MGKMVTVCWTWLLFSAVLQVHGYLHSESQIAISDSDDLEVDLTEQDVSAGGAMITSSDPPRKLRGIPDVTAEAGKLLQFTVPGDAFTGNVLRLQVTSPLPNWLSFTPETRTFFGLPLSTDKSDALISVVAHGDEYSQLPAHAIFRVHVRRQPATTPCSTQPLVLTIFVDRKLSTIHPQQRAVAMDNLARFFGINISAFTLGAQKPYIETVDSSVILAGPGNVKRRSSKQQTSNIDLLVGCGNKLWENYISLMKQLKEQARDGTLSEVLGFPVLAWRVQQEANTLERGRRDTPSEGGINEEFKDYYEEEYDEEYTDDYDEGITTMIPTPVETAPATVTIPTTSEPETTTHHAHRHHHGDPLQNRGELMPQLFVTDADKSELPPTTTSYITPTVTPSSAQTTQPTTKADIEYYTDDLEEDDDLTDDYDVSETEVPFVATAQTTTEATTHHHVFSSVIPSSSSSSTISSSSRSVASSTTTEITSSRAVQTTTEIEPETSTAMVITTVEDTTTTEPSTATTTNSPSTTTYYSTTPSPQTSPSTIPVIKFIPPTTTTQQTTTEEAEMSTTIVSTTTEEPTTPPPLSTTTEKQYTSLPPSTTATQIRFTEIEYAPRNNAPVINQRLKKLRITAGTVLSYFIPEDTFTDYEDGTNLVLKFLDIEGAPVKKNFWIQFNERTREIYGLPLEEHVSKWEFVIEATDKEGAQVKDTLEVTVQQHKGRRAVTHEFTLQMRVEKKNEFPTAVDWQLRTLRGLASLFHNKDLTQIVVRQINFSTDFVAFTWTNDSLPRSYCPKGELDYLLSIMVANIEGDPSFALSQVLSPELRVKNVEYRGIGQCEEKPEPPVSPPKAFPTNFSPIPRNQVDHINATVGELLVFRVPDDTFYDPEDGDARNLKMSLLTMDRHPLSSDHWLQFDVKNQEFFGVPLAADIGRQEYQLVCEDRGGLTANDGLVVTVNAAPRVRYNVEFSMTLETPYETFINSASIKRKFVEKLRDLFRDRDTSSIRINSIMEGSTVVSWNNKTLATDPCPNKEIRRLRQVLVNDDETYADRVEVIMGPEFPVSAISLTPIGICQGEMTVVHTAAPPVEEQPSANASDEYLITFIVPAVIISVMLALAGIVACVLYRRRRTGKMNVEDDERMTNFRSKGIPVIFQDEIDEKPESGTKAPVILKEEKPPLAPPEYSKSATPVPPHTPQPPTVEENSDAPYQPPPPFAASNQDNGRQSRPKPTPTYRKPPPYVPP